ncbi:hypothetical protein C8Q75DRAFT_737924 [Abortiporus biennis]|nr:hypothetical protein C8Q75DRAFT_737924 [Abortiporus biennis]
MIFASLSHEFVVISTAVQYALTRRPTVLLHSLKTGVFRVDTSFEEIAENTERAQVRQDFMIGPSSVSSLGSALPSLFYSLFLDNHGSHADYALGTRKRAQSLKEELLSFWFTLDLQDSARLSESSKYFLYALSLPESRYFIYSGSCNPLQHFGCSFSPIGNDKISTSMSDDQHDMNYRVLSIWSEDVDIPTSHWYGLGPYSQNAIQFKGEGTVHLVFSADCFLEKAFVYSEPSELTYAGNPSGDAWVNEECMGDGVTTAGFEIDDPNHNSISQDDYD